jgi:hypothetical protein
LKRARRLSYVARCANLLIVVALLGCQQQGKDVLRDEFRTNPPHVANLRLRPDGNGVIALAQIRDTARVGPRFSARLEEGVVIFRDDGKGRDSLAGDGVYSARVKLDHVALKRRYDSLLSSVGSQGIPVYEGRHRLPASRFFKPTCAVNPAGCLEIEVPRNPGRLDPAPRDNGIMARSLVITDPRVVQDPQRTYNACTGVGNANGKWTFGYMMTQLANQSLTGISPQEFTRRWLAHWEVDQTINNWVVKKRPVFTANVTGKWLQKSAGVNTIGSPGRSASSVQRLDLTQAPFRLLAIVNRIDMAEDVLFAPGNVGEIHFVFGFVDLANNCATEEGTVIFEFGVNRNDCSELKTWAQQWLDLSNSSVQYNQRLENLTDPIVRAGARPDRPNHSALNRLRTNEALFGGVWDLREFVIFDNDSDHGHLRQVTVKQTPDESVRTTATVGEYINNNATQIRDRMAEVPLMFPAATHFLGGAATTGTSAGSTGSWSGGTISDMEARHLFSLGTCNGCHGGETETRFTHIRPSNGTRDPRLRADLSGFMTGDIVRDTHAGVDRVFNELERRTLYLTAVASATCTEMLMFRPLNFTH